VDISQNVSRSSLMFLSECYLKLFGHFKPSVAGSAVCLEPITAARLADNLLARASLFLGKDFGAPLINSCFIKQTSFSFSKP